ncbi:MAG: hypothetical protein KDB27_30745 [Planctomycetales bacterium]|nr:hypothetical protein [Planctomycetales bacterium]
MGYAGDMATRVDLLSLTEQKTNGGPVGSILSEVNLGDAVWVANDIFFQPEETSRH